MQKFISQALCAAVLMGACITDAAVPTVQDASLALRKPVSFSTQISTFHRSVRHDVVQALGLGERPSTSASSASDDLGGTNTALMLVGALAIMGVMVRRRWSSRD